MRNGFARPAVSACPTGPGLENSSPAIVQFSIPAVTAGCERTVANILVTGGAGFIGSHLTEALLARGDSVTVVDDESTGRAANLAAVQADPRLTIVRGSIGDAALIPRVLDGVSEVYHLAAAVGVALIAREPLQTIERNIYPT